jgi:hypothetical protein
MERVHLKPRAETRLGPRPETRTGRDCQFCRQSDLNFAMRAPQDRLVISKGDDSAAAHMTENGYVQHRSLEVRIRLAVTTGSWQHVA